MTTRDFLNISIGCLALATAYSLSASTLRATEPEVASEFVSFLVVQREDSRESYVGLTSDGRVFLRSYDWINGTATNPHVFRLDRKERVEWMGK